MGLRYATPEEIQSVKFSADLEAGCIVLAQDTPSGTILGVVRTVPEFDPVFYPEGVADKSKRRFIENVEAYLMGQGLTHYYFNVQAEDEPGDDQAKWIECCENWGAQRTSLKKEYRFKRIL